MDCHINCRNRTEGQFKVTASQAVKYDKWCRIACREIREALSHNDGGKDAVGFAPFRPADMRNPVLRPSQTYEISDNTVAWDGRKPSRRRRSASVIGNRLNGMSFVRLFGRLNGKQCISVVRSCHDIWYLSYGKLNRWPSVRRDAKSDDICIL